jgi:hypothetical protein
MEHGGGDETGNGGGMESMRCCLNGRVWLTGAGAGETDPAGCRLFCKMTPILDPNIYMKPTNLDRDY